MLLSRILLIASCFHRHHIMPGQNWNRDMDRLVEQESLRYREIYVQYLKIIFRLLTIILRSRSYGTSTIQLLPFPCVVVALNVLV